MSTKQCIHYFRSICSKGDKCEFSHNVRCTFGNKCNKRGVGCLFKHPTDVGFETAINAAPIVPKDKSAGDGDKRAPKVPHSQRRHFGDFEVRITDNSLATIMKVLGDSSKLTGPDASQRMMAVNTAFTDITKAKVSIARIVAEHDKLINELAAIRNNVKASVQKLAEKQIMAPITDSEESSEE
jgi:hypothetical protein